MPTVNLTATANGTDQFNQFNQDGGGGHIISLGTPQPANLYFNNPSLYNLPCWVYAYNAAGVFSGIIYNGTLAPQAVTNVTWDTANPNYAQTALIGNTLSAGTWHVSLTWAGGSGPICPYGTQQKDPNQRVLEGGLALLDALGIAEQAPWAIVPILGTLATPITLSLLCAAPPPVDANIDPGDWVSPGTGGAQNLALQKILNKFTIRAWDHYCQCTPGTSGQPSPTPPNVTINWNQPTSYISNNTSISESNLSIAINTLTQIIQSNQNWSQTITNIVNEIQNCACNGAYTAGTVHAGLSGDGEIAVSGLRGLLVQVDPIDPPYKELAGNPPYLWDVGWLSIDNGDGMLEEKRLTRYLYVWLPASMALATSFNWHIQGDGTVQITELLPA